MSTNAAKGCAVLVHTCAQVKPHERITIVTDDVSKAIAEEMFAYASKEFEDVTMVCMKTRSNHAVEPTAGVAAAMARADVIFSVTAFSLYSTQARMDACAAGARFVNMADYSMSMLEEGCLFIDFAELTKMVDDVSDRLVGDVCTLTSPAGTNFKCSVAGRNPLRGHGFITKAGSAGSPPDFEAAIGPTDGTSEGVLVFDASVPYPGVGILKEPIVATVEKGFITKIEGGEQAKVLADALAAYNDKNVYLIAEIGCGLNTGAKISGRMLEDEGVYGTIHIGIGDNLAFGGTNQVPSHIDALMFKPTLTIDGRMIYKDGVIVEE
ncbi:hypothetical protein [Chakrabartyella piscis]|uniref:aminopeptidase n=1 Tax=Chakrabartyella piscis TaxID=2918914 RepID=UPI002958842C|nr:hypothetical protein [Chakrabartyella piscis]